MERLRYHDGPYPHVCLTCPARTYISGEYFCDMSRLDDESRHLRVARYKPAECRKSYEPVPREFSPETILRKMLRK